MTGRQDQPPRILVADDEPAITTLIAEVLTYFGFDVLQARGGTAALLLARTEIPDLVLLDVMMPDLDGRDACRALKLETGLLHIPIILFSSADERDIDWKAAGADAFLQKPFSIRTLPDLVRSFIGTQNS